MAKKLICPICGTEFETNMPNKIYCSLTCKEANRILKRMKWKDSNPEYYKNYMRAYRTKNK